MCWGQLQIGDLTLGNHWHDIRIRCREPKKHRPRARVRSRCQQAQEPRQGAGGVWKAHNWARLILTVRVSQPCASLRARCCPQWVNLQQSSRPSSLLVWRPPWWWLTERTCLSRMTHVHLPKLNSRPHHLDGICHPAQSLPLMPEEAFPSLSCDYSTLELVHSCVSTSMEATCHGSYWVQLAECKHSPQIKAH